MNLPGHSVHDITHSYGRIWIPWFGGWIGRSERGYWCVFRTGHFHNCTWTGIR